MRFDTSQHMKLGQHMRLAPRMIQSMEILQLPLLALQERIEQELESNITLETVEPGDGAERADEPSGDTNDSDRVLEIGEGGGASDFERLDSMEQNYAEAFENEYSASGLTRVPEPGAGPGRARLDGERDRKMDAMANTAARGASLNEQLATQWSLAEVPDDVRVAGDLIISFIDADGYLRTTLEEIADRAPAGEPRPSPELLAEALAELQHFLEPPGVAARDTRECLLLQLDASDPSERDEVHAVARLLIADHLDDLLHNRMPKIAQKADLEIDVIKAGVERMQRLSVAPGRSLVDESPPAIVPDAIIEYDDEHDRYFAYLNDNVLPNLRLNRRYAEMARNGEVEKQTRDFLRTSISNAQWLIDAVSQRKHTLQRVLNVVTEAQRDFFDQGPQALRPLPMTQVADQLGVHVATVSRAVAGKFVQTPRGVMPLRRFFSGGMQTDDGEEMSWDAIKAALQEVVDAEDKASPLSDEALVDALKARGIEIARRTVAKYRAQLDIPPARMRKRY